MNHKVITTIDGQVLSFTGKLSKDGKTLHCAKGMILTINTTDTIEQIEPKPKAKRTQQAAYMPGGIYSFFKATKQI